MKKRRRAAPRIRSERDALEIKGTNAEAYATKGRLGRRPLRKPNGNLVSVVAVLEQAAVAALVVEEQLAASAERRANRGS